MPPRGSLARCSKDLLNAGRSGQWPHQWCRGSGDEDVVEEKQLREQTWS